MIGKRFSMRLIGTWCFYLVLFILTFLFFHERSKDLRKYQIRKRIVESAEKEQTLAEQWDCFLSL